MITPDLFEQLGPEHFATVDRIELIRETDEHSAASWKLQAFSGDEDYYAPMYSLPGDIDDLRRLCDLVRTLIITQEKSRHAAQKHGR